MPTPVFDHAAPSDLVPYGNNPRKHPKRQIAKLKASFSEFGMTNPILVDEAGVIIAGHGRHQAARELAMAQVPVVRISGLTEPQKRALRIADNRLGEGSSWSMPELRNELMTVIEADVEIGLTGFDIIEIDKIVTPDVGAAADEPPLPPPPDRPVSRLGDIWLLGRHKIMCADARQLSPYQALMPSYVADMVLTDPPYNIRIGGNVSGLGAVAHREFAMASGEMSEEGFKTFLAGVLDYAQAFSRNGALHFLFMDWRSLDLLVGVGRTLYSQLLNIIAWIKPNPGMGSFYRSQHELIAVFKKGDAPHINNIQLGRMGRNRSNVWQYPGASGFSKTRKQDLADHPTVKPVRLVADAIRDATKPGDLVLDPFGGAGTTLLAAEQTDRRAVLLEIDPVYVDVTLRRFQEQTGIAPLLLPDRIPLERVRGYRHAEEMCNVG